ncbi:two-component system, LuxR family, response regulator [Oryzomicrobium terrae]|uniref:Two-component system, LuxR family, response regulator n=1 Tax=Oryzomicrobium terrae TaxID=1735038 RepID=A0A5C1E926_9RHOO|nr:response regulator [Oryzomicrobium terrae]QEL65370.1 two-component system, LuxR family, response regulator [Oryzomicrobium terrae]
MNGTVHIVDDDEAIRDALGWLLQSRGLAWQGYDSAEAFHQAVDQARAGCLVLDIRMGGMSGLELFNLLSEQGFPLPVIFLTGHGDVPMAVSALKKGAFDFFEKPFNDNDLVNRVIEALENDARRRDQETASDSIRHKLDALTPRERQIMDLILAGKYNKVIADELSISMRTVEVHRANLLDKMGVRTAVELARLLQSATEGRSAP